MFRRLLPILLLGSIATAAEAQLPTPRAEREPDPAAVREAERAAGLGPDAAARSQDGRSVDQIYQELTGQRPDAAAPPVAPPRPPGEARTEDRLYRELTGQNPDAPPPGTPLPGLRQGSQTPAIEQIFRELTQPAPR